MTVKEYTLTDVSDNLESLHDMAMFINSGSYTEQIHDLVLHCMLDRIEELQGVVSFMGLYPQIKAKELAEKTMNLENSNEIQLASNH